MECGEEIGVHIEDEDITPEGLIAGDGRKPIGGRGYDDYAIVVGDWLLPRTSAG